MAGPKKAELAASKTLNAPLTVARRLAIAEPRRISCSAARRRRGRASVGNVREKIERELAPRLIVAASTVTLPARVAATVRRAAGRRGRLELYFGFDDPASAYAVIDLARRLEGRSVIFDLRAVARRGIEGDPALERKRAYVITDARRLARRLGLTLLRTEPVDPQATAFLAAWVDGAPRGSALTQFTIAAMMQLWFESTGELTAEPYERIWRRCFGSAPPAAGDPPSINAVRAAEKQMSRRGPYETPAAWVAGRWFFAQDRPQQIANWLDQLGWSVER